jgi:hypothetical protein
MFKVPNKHLMIFSGEGKGSSTATAVQKYCQQKCSYNINSIFLLARRLSW